MPVELCPFCVPDELAPESGRVLGDCELFEEIGRGGMGVVWRGRQRGLDREVAVKTLPGGNLAGADARARFRTEAKAAARLKHPGIVAIYDVGEDDGMPYFVMEFVHGKTLFALAAEKPLAPQLAARLLRDAALAVAHAHEHGVLHRDVKPSNILVEPSADGGTSRVMDFGLAKFTDAESSLTMSGAAAGSPAYMAPEQARGAESTVLTDVYGLGASLYAALTGRAPHTGESLATVFAQVEREEPLAPRRLNPSVPRDLETICLRCLEKNPANRYASAQAVSDDLTRFLNDEPVIARPIGAVAKTLRLARRRPWHASAVLLAVAIVVGVISSLAWNARTERLHQQALSLVTMRAQLGEARAVIRLRTFDSRPRAEKIVQAVLAKQPPADIRAEARDVALAALALHSAHTEPLLGEGTVMQDWTMVAADLVRSRWALAEYNGRVSIRVMDSAVETATFNIAPRVVTALIAFSPGGRWLAIRHREELVILDTTTGTIAFAAKPWTGTNRFGFMKIAFAPDDSHVLWIDAGSIVASALPGGAEVARWSGIETHALAFEPGGKSVAVALANSPSAELRAWPGGEVLNSFNGIFPQVLSAITVAPGARRIAGGDTAGRITVWQPATTHAPLEFRGHNGAIRALTFSAEGRTLASTSEDGSLRLWDCGAEEIFAVIPFEAGVPSVSRDMTRIGAGCAAGRVSVVKVVPSPCLHTFRPSLMSDSQQTLAIFPDSASLACVVAGGVAQVRIPDGEQMRTFACQSPSAVQPEADGRALVVAAKDGILRFPLDPATASQVLFPAVKSGWGGLAASGDGRLLAASDSAGGVIAVWPAGANSADAKFLSLTEPGPGPLALSADGTRIAAAHRYEPGLHILGALTRRIELPPRHQIAWSADDRFLAACGSSAMLWNTRDWTPLPLSPIEPNAPPAGAVAFSPNDSRMLAMTTGSTQIRLIALPELTVLATLQAPQDSPIYKLEFSRNGRWLATATARGHIQLWDMQEIAVQFGKLGLAW